FSKHNYQVIRELGRNREGGRISYLGKQLNLSDLVVLKQFRFVQGDATWQGFKVYEREISILQQLNHPRIPKYLDSFETPDGFCMVQEYKNAPSLAANRHFFPDATKKIASSVLKILVYLQSMLPPIIHRDIKPENILVDRDNNAYLIDFGLARIRDKKFAVSSIAAGTPGFMAPEEVFNCPLTQASDLYSLGATLISILTHTTSVLKFLAIGGVTLAWMGIIVNIASNFGTPSPVKEPVTTTSTTPVGSNSTDARRWYEQIKSRCNSVEVLTAMRSNSPPNTTEGVGYGAACYALAGKIDQADLLIQQLPESEKEKAAGIVFQIGHPVADAGDDASAGPIMRLVVKYQSWNYMALYHAGMSYYILGDSDMAKQHLEAFLAIYDREDGWRRNAITVLKKI
ncbi:MAG: serine/threonine-protein kinase, partial [Prochloron sp. SP5CPC1]|nr:serine/threonine-protein kinase [Candidatus Paraprochloron terpiosi SP5CPC1]